MKMVNIVNFGVLAALSLTVTAEASAKEVRMAFPLALPPYVMADSSNGFELDIIREALALKGHTLKPLFVPLARVPVMIENGEVDASERGLPELTEDKGYFYAADTAVKYQDVAVTVSKDQVPLSSIADLKGKSIIAFQGATKYLGDQFASAVAGNANYQETPDQKRQPLMLYAHRVQVIVGDKNIFAYFRQQVRDQVNIDQDVTYHPIFASSASIHNHPVFSDRSVRDDFDDGLKQLRSAGKDKAIISKYISDSK